MEVVLPQFIAYEPPSTKLVIPERKQVRAIKPWAAIGIGVAGLAAVLLAAWLVAWQMGAAPAVSLQGLKELYAKLVPPAAPPTPALVKIKSDAWNLMFEASSESWSALHPGGANRLCTLVNLQDADCQVAFTATVHGTLPKDNLNLQTSNGESLGAQLFRFGVAAGASEQGATVERKDIGGKIFQLIRQDLPQSADFFRPSAVTQFTYALLENNTAYEFAFIARGSKAFDRLPALAETILRTVRPVVKDMEFSTMNNLTLSDPQTMADESGLSLPSPGPEWSILPDAPTRFAAMGAFSQTRAYLATQADQHQRPIAAGGLGAPACGYQTNEGDLCGLAVFHLPKEVQVETGHLADLILAAWFPKTSIDRQLERSFQAGALPGTEYSGQISRELSPSPFVFRLLRRGPNVYAIGACSFSEKHSLAQLSQALDRATWSAPKIELTALSGRYTPLVCQELWEHIIITLGKEKQQANQLAEASDLYEQAFQTVASYPILLAYCEALAKLGQAERATTLIESEWRNLPRQANFLMQAAHFLAHHGRLESATLLVTTALQHSLNDKHAVTYELVEAYLNELRAVQARDEALRVLDLLARRAPSNGWRLWESYILYNNPETKRRAVEIMEGLITGVKKNRELARDMLTFLKEHKAHNIGLDAAMGVLRLDPQEGMAWLMRAICERALGDDKKATETLVKARQYNPSLRDLDDLAYAITDEVGGPVLTDDGPQAPPIPLPAEVQRLLKSEPYASTPKTGDPFQYLYRIRSVTYDPGSPFTSTNRYSIRIQNSSGMEAFNILKIPFHPRGERIQINELRVRTPDGKSIAPASMKEAFVTEDSSEGMLTGLKLLNVPVPGLTPGCTLDYTVTEQSLGVVDGPLTSSFHFASDMPCALDVLYIHSPVAKVEYRHSTGTKPLKLPTGLVWVERSLPGITDELHQPSLEKIVPVLWTGDGAESWARLGLEYLSLIQHKIKPEEIITKLARDRTKNCKTDAEKISVLSQYVRDTLSYAAIEFGMRGLIPNTANESIKNRYGDCKDHSVLLYQLLRAVGIPAKLVLANASTAVQPDLPALGAFNHMITAVPGATKGEWDFIDGTNKFMAPKAGVPPLMLAGKYVLVLGEASSEFSADASKLLKIKEISEENESVVVDRTAQVVDSRHLSIKETIHLTGLTACEMRYLLAKNTERRDTKSALQRLLGMNRDRTQVKFGQVQNLLELEQPLTINLEYEVRNACSPIGQTINVRLPNLTALRFLDPDTIGETRRSPFEFTTPVKLTLHTKLFGPVGKGLVPMEVPNEGKRFVRWSASQSSTDGKSELLLTLTRKTGVFPAADYDDFQAQIAEATQSVEEVSLVPSPNQRELTTQSEHK